jgi:hypothetical protein
MSNLNIDLGALLQAARAAGALNGATGQAEKEASLTLSTVAPMYGCTPLWSPTGSNDLLTLSVPDDKFSTWLGWQANDECTQTVKLLSYVGPADAGGSPSNGAAAACADAPGSEYGACEIMLPDKGRIKRSGPVRDVTEVNRRPYQGFPMFTKQGKPISNDLVWSFTVAGNTLKQDLMRMLITGNNSNANEFAGLETLITTGYKDMNTGNRCRAMDSTVLAWSSQPMSYKADGTHTFVDYLIAIVRKIRNRANATGLGGIAYGDMVLMMPDYLRNALLDSFTCWSVCPGAQYNEANMQTFEARNFRNSLNGGLYGDGQITVDGEQIPILVNGWMTIGQAAPYFTGDVYVLTRMVGNVPLMYGQYINMDTASAALEMEAPEAHYKAVDGGRFLTYWKYDNECVQSTIVMRPNLFVRGPWAQARITDVGTLPVVAPESFDPTSGYFPGTPVAAATTPYSYLIAGI